MKKFNRVNKRLMVVGLMLAGFINNANAQSHTSQLATHAGAYIEPKVIYTMGEEVSHGTSTLDGDAGYGIGFDLGYSFNGYFALELDGTYSKSDVTETDSLGASETSSAEFYTYGVTTVLTYPVTEHFILLGKIGYGYEYEDLGSLDIKGTEGGIAWSAGIEYSFNPHVEVSLEYEGADVESARGDNIQMGLIYKF